MNSSLKFVVFGAGNVAFHFIQALISKNFNIVQIVGRSENNTKYLAEKFHLAYTTNKVNVRKDADVYLYCTSDNSLNELISLKIATDAIHIHTAGSVEMDVFKNLKSRYGVIYPLQTLSKTKNIDFETKVPLFIEASDADTLKIVQFISESIAQQVSVANSEKRLSLHISAVFANNFVNQLYQIAFEILAGQQIDFINLKPLIQETADKIKFMLPKDAQTGPAKRMDTVIMSKHLDYLSKSIELQSLYRQISEMIYHTQSNSK